MKVICVLFRPAKVMASTANTAHYTPTWANKLYRGFQRHLHVPFTFHCITDHLAKDFHPNIQVHDFAYPKHVGKWMCINEIFRPDITGDDLCLFCGLDTVITGDVTPLSTYEGNFAMLSHPRKPEVMMNAVTLYRGCGWIWDRYRQDPEKADAESLHKASTMQAAWPANLASEMLWWHTLMPDVDDIRIEFPSVPMTSYRMERNHEASSIVFFHHKTKPQDCLDDPVIKKNWT